LATALTVLLGTALMSASAIGFGLSRAHKPRFESTALDASRTDPATGYNVNNNMWNCPQPACGRQLIWANSSSDWGVVATMAKNNTAVLTYPDVQELWPDVPLSSARRLDSTFRQSMPRDGIYEAAYDVWLNNWNTEIMIWVDTVHEKLYTRRIGTAVLGGQRFTVYASSGKSHGFPSGPFDFALNRNEASGRVDILGAIRWLERRGYLRAASERLSAVDFGWEICSTVGKAERFSVSRFAISASGIR
jgi:hypothetical protein